MKYIDADKLKEIICKYYNPKLYEHIFKIIDELSEEREDVVRIKGSEFCNEEPNEYMKFTDWAVREGYTTKVPNSIMNLFIHYLESINKHKKEQPNPLKVAIKGDGTDKYAVLLFNYFYEYCVKCRLMVDDFIPELYYHIENDKVVYCPHLPKGYTEISLKNNKPTGLIPDLERRVEAIEKQSNRWCDKFQKQKINYREAIERVEELETELTEIKLKLKDLSK